MQNDNGKLDLIFQRRSIRCFTGEAVSEMCIQKMLEAAMAAPSACARDPWEFIVLTDREALKRAAAALPNGKFLADAGCGIMVCGSVENAHAQSLSYLLQDCSAAIQNILLAAAAMDLGSCWLGVHPREERIIELRQSFNIPEDVLVIGIVAVGHPAVSPEPRTRFSAGKVHRNSWK